MRHQFFIFLKFLLFYCICIETRCYSAQYSFIENKGQIIDQNNNLNPAVKYLWNGNGMKVQLKINSFSYEVLKTIPNNLIQLTNNIHGKHKFRLNLITVFSHRIDIELLHANPSPQIIAEEQSKDYLNYYTTATPEAGVTNVHHFTKVTYQNIYPNIDLEFVLEAANQQTFKYNFIVRPGGRVSDIQLKYNGAKSTELTASGSLNIVTAYGNVEERIPSSYIAETGKNIAVHYQQNREAVYGFIAENYNGLQTLVIDPWATYYGGSNLDEFYSVTNDNLENIVSVGSTNSLTNIASSGAYQTVISDTIGDAFVVKLAPNGSRIWATYYGGNKLEGGYSIVTDKNNNIYFAGSTLSSSNIASGGFQLNLNSVNGNAFLVKLNSLGLRIWATYYGGNISDYLESITIDNSNNIIGVGTTTSLTGIASPSSFQTIFGGISDAFIVKFDSLGNRIWGTYFGGIETEYGIGIKTDLLNNIIVCGYTESINSISSTNSFQPTLIGTGNAFLAKFNSFGQRQWCTYYGSSIDDGLSIASDNNDNVILFGYTSSIAGIATLGAYQSTLAGSNDMFIVKFTNSGSRLWGTYFGGNLSEVDFGSVSTDNSDNIFICGATNSTIGIASPASFQTYLKGDNDAFVSKFNANGSNLWSTYFGGNNYDGFQGVSINYNNSIIVCGGTQSDTIKTVIPFQAIYGGGNGDGFIACFDSTGHIPSVGLQELHETIPSLIKVYPNPAKDKITVSINDNACKGGSLVLMDVEGKVVKSAVVKSAECSLDVKDLSAGVYLLQYEDGEVCETVKFVKE